MLAHKLSARRRGPVCTRCRPVSFFSPRPPFLQTRGQRGFCHYIVLREVRKPPKCPLIPPQIPVTSVTLRARATAHAHCPGEQQPRGKRKQTAATRGQKMEPQRQCSIRIPTIHATYTLLCRHGNTVLPAPRVHTCYTYIPSSRQLLADRAPPNRSARLCIQAGLSGDMNSRSYICQQIYRPSRVLCHLCPRLLIWLCRYHVAPSHTSQPA